MIRYIWISFCLSTLLISCQSSGNSSNEHDHEGHNHALEAEGHEEHAVESKTLFSEQTELFVEYPTLIVGETSDFTTHLTHLETYKPYTEGKLTVSLIKGEKGIRQTLKAPNRDGIFIPSLMPKEAGKFTLVFDVESKYGKEQFCINDVVVFKNHEEAEKESPMHTEDESSTSFLKEQAWKIDFATSEVKATPFQEVIKTTGTLTPSANMEIQLVAQSSGIIHFYSPDIVAGKDINKNEPIIYISGKGLSENNIETKYIEAKAELEKAKAEFERATNLRSDQIVSEKDFLLAKTNFEKAQVNFNSINASYSDKGLTITSPVTGYICEINVSEGQFVEKGSLLGKIDRKSKLFLKVDVYQKHLQKLSQIKSANFKLPYRDEVFNTNALNGKLIAFGKDIHPDDYTTPLYFEIDFTPGLYAGSFVEVFLLSETANKVLNIQKSAVLEDQGIKYVFVQTGGESYTKRFVTLGADNGTDVEIISGLKAGERVVSKGVYFIKLASLAGSLPAHSHEH